MRASASAAVWRVSGAFCRLPTTASSTGTARRSPIRPSAQATAARQQGVKSLCRNSTPGPSGSVPGEPMMDTDQFQNWVTAVRSRKPSDLYAEIEEGHLSSTMAHLANIAYATGRTLQFDPKQEKFPGDEEANRLLTRNYRAPYVVPETV